MNVLVVGFGSIGQRHLTNLMELYPENNYFVLKNSDKKEVIQNCQILDGLEIYSYYETVEFFRTFDDINLNAIDVAFICNDSSKHLDAAFILLENNIDMFIEKPIDSDFKKVLEFYNSLIGKNVIVMVGYQTRFHPVYLKIKEIFNEIKNDINYMEIKWANYLPSFHEYEDYTKSYAGKAELGGGALLTLSHEINILNSFFKDCKLVASMSGFSKGLSMDVEDLVFALFKCEDIKINFTLGYSQVHEERYIKFQTYNKYIVGDLISNTIIIFNSNGTQEKYNFNLKRNELFKDETKYFFNCIKTRKIQLNTVEESVSDMALINEIKRHKNFNCL